MSKMKIRRAEKKDLPEIMRVYEYARHFMAENGNETQWGNNYPQKEMLINDINDNNLYAAEISGRICGVFAFIIGEDETYAVIEDGKWLSDSEYGTIHRIAGDGTVHGFFEAALSFCCERIKHIRIDTHDDNKIMQHIIEKNGFIKCGKIYISDGTPRIAYEKCE